MCRIITRRSSRNEPGHNPAGEGCGLSKIECEALSAGILLTRYLNRVLVRGVIQERLCNGAHQSNY